MITIFKGTPLSNFWSTPITLEGFTYSNVEAAFQAFKVFGSDRKQFVGINPATAKRLGRKVKLRENWEDVKYDLMYQCLKAKFKNEDMKSYLLSTGSQILVEGNYWHDNEWGSCNCAKCQNKLGKNMLGKLLMKVRDELQ